MNNRSRFGLLVLLIALTMMVLLFNRKEPEKFAGCPGNDIDITKMLQYGEQVQNIMKTDRYGQVLDLKNFHNKPLLLVFVKDNIAQIRVFDDSLHKRLNIFIAKGLNIVFINSGGFEKESPIGNHGKSAIYCDTDSMALFNAFKVYKHSSCIILNTNHKVILSTITTVTPGELEKIICYKNAEIF